ncbi:MAG TPA: 23S rRNA (adenine(2030)-N(6))-methyltransferase RlmJ [Spirochaetaceae bacterium]|jgi:23S rRNA (adenine2030-N6)-methyltransferase|nr:23S rRNA (adenine(2030)-N(6))-methyltransferase RlmJ [Spirochaetaceae bacterium]
MLSYRHAFHAGNHADILKHTALVCCLDYMTKKDVPLLYVDSHAGAGAYQLDTGYASQNREWEEGYARLLSYANGSPERRVSAPLSYTPSAAVPEALRAYLEAIAAFRARPGAESSYPGSPALALSRLRAHDRAVFFELHPSDCALLLKLCSEEPRARVRREDGFSGLKAVLPPASKRALCLVDPSYELASDYEGAQRALREALKRFATGSFLLWYPLLERAEAKAFPALLRSEAEAAGRPWLDARLWLRVNAPGERGMAGSGIIAVNPPFALVTALGECLPYLAAALSPATGGWSLDTSSA